MIKALRRSSARYLLLSGVLVSVLFLFYYVNHAGNSTGAVASLQQQQQQQSKDMRALAQKSDSSVPNNGVQESAGQKASVSPPRDNKSRADNNFISNMEENDHSVSSDTCPIVQTAKTDVDTYKEFPNFDFQPSWMKNKEYWDNTFEERYQKRKKKWPDLPLKVIVVPHSHNDPGWLKTYEGYFHSQTRQILNNMVEKLQQYPNMTFIWTEISFFAKWWESAHPTKRRVVRKLIDDGRLEVATGGWVMTDEATVHLYAMLDQLIEGHQWVKSNLGITPRSGWSVDPFGHGSTVPYLLREAGLENMVIQRIHYAWKQWLAQKQYGDFMWRQRWDRAGKHDILCHNAPYDIYSIKHSCGPHPQVCLAFDFRKIPNEFTEYTMEAVPITPQNVKAKAELLLEQYGRTASLFPHNVVLVPIGDDFRFTHDIEWDQQFGNYHKLFDYINQNSKHYEATVQFGTLDDYFKAVRSRMERYPSLQGDFFVYSDIFSEGRPAYWSGYFTTRPYWKLLDRELEAALRSAEILYTVALNRARQQNVNRTVQVLERDYEKLVSARQALALFQHHDAITGTSRAYVMQDYGLKMFDALQDVVSVQSRGAQALLADDLALHPQHGQSPQPQPQGQAFLLPDSDREAYDKLARRIPITIRPGETRRVVLFNSLGQHRQEVVRIVTQTPHIRVMDSDENPLVFQINPVWNLTSEGLVILPDLFEVLFVAELPPLSLSTFILERSSTASSATRQTLHGAAREEERAVVYCAKCGGTTNYGVSGMTSNSPFDVRPLQAGDIQLDNHKMRLLFDGHTGFLKAITNKITGKTSQVGIQFAAYPSAQFHSGAYLFMPDPNSRSMEKEVLVEGTQQVFIVSGPVVSEISVLYDRFLLHTVHLYHMEKGALADAVGIENLVDFEMPPKHRETELFMRFVSDINNGDPPRFYTDQNGFQMQPRVKVERIGIEGNYFPITSAAFIQDKARRLSLLVTHAHGAASWQRGWLEVMLDRRTLYDDSRGMGEGVVDNKRMVSRYFMLLEDLIEESNQPSEETESLSLLGNHLSNNLIYPANIFVVDGVEKPQLRTRVSLLSRPLPCDVHLVNMRTLSDQFFYQFPSSSALLVLQRQGYSCRVPSVLQRCSAATKNSEGNLHVGTNLKEVQVVGIARTSITGLHPIDKLKNFDEVQIDPMEVKTFNVTFAL